MQFLLFGYLLMRFLQRTRFTTLFITKIKKINTTFYITTCCKSPMKKALTKC